jgi:hypothetical protein
MGKHKRSANGHNARVTLMPTPFSTHIYIYIYIKLWEITQQIYWRHYVTGTNVRCTRKEKKGFTNQNVAFLLKWILNSVEDLERIHMAKDCA